MGKHLLIPLLVFISFASYAAELPFPDNLGGFKSAGTTNYEKDHPGLGYSHSYWGRNATASIFLYTRNEVVPSELEHPYFKAEFRSAYREFETYSEQQDRESVQFKKVGSLSNIGNHQCRSFLASYVKDNVPNISLTCIMPFNGKFLKLRYSFVPVSNSGQRERMGKFFNAFSEFLSQHEVNEEPKKTPNE